LKLYEHSHIRAFVIDATLLPTCSVFSSCIFAYFLGTLSPNEMNLLDAPLSLPSCMEPQEIRIPKFRSFPVVTREIIFPPIFSWPLQNRTKQPANSLYIGWCSRSPIRPNCWPIPHSASSSLTARYIISASRAALPFPAFSSRPTVQGSRSCVNCDYVRGRAIGRVGFKSGPLGEHISNVFISRKSDLSRFSSRTQIYTGSLTEPATAIMWNFTIAPIPRELSCASA
jgi:hypothetical protein